MAAAGTNPLMPAYRRGQRRVERRCRCGAKRTTFAGGRPSKPRCECGRITVARLVRRRSGMPGFCATRHRAPELFAGGRAEDALRVRADDTGRGPSSAIAPAGMSRSGIPPLLGYPAHNRERRDVERPLQRQAPAFAGGPAAEAALRVRG